MQQRRRTATSEELLLHCTALHCVWLAADYWLKQRAQRTQRPAETSPNLLTHSRPARCNNTPPQATPAHDTATSDLHAQHSHIDRPTTTLLTTPPPLQPLPPPWVCSSERCSPNSSVRRMACTIVAVHTAVQCSAVQCSARVGTQRLIVDRRVTAGWGRGGAPDLAAVAVSRSAIAPFVRSAPGPVLCSLIICACAGCGVGIAADDH